MVGSTRRTPPIIIAVLVRVFLLLFAGAGSKLLKLLLAQAIQERSQCWLELSLRQALDPIESPLLNRILHEAQLSQGIHELCVEVRIIDFSDLRPNKMDDILVNFTSACVRVRHGRPSGQRQPSLYRIDGDCHCTVRGDARHAVW